MYRRSLLAAATLGLAPPGTAHAQGFPTRPVRVIVGFPPGGGTDLLARPLAQRLQATLGQPAVVENRGGANGNLGLEAVAKSVPDGYTIGHVNSSVVVTNPLLYGGMAIDVARDLLPVCMVGDGAVVIVVPADLPVHNLSDLIALARAQPGRLNFGSGGLGSVDHLAFEVLRWQTGVDILHAPYRGGGPALQDMLGGRIQLMISSFGMYKAQVDAGRLRILAILGRERHPSLPDVPTSVEQGWPDLLVPVWQGVVAPAQTPAAVVARLEEAYRVAVADPEVRTTLESQGYFAVFRGQQDMARMMREDAARWALIIREARIRLE
ncbi:MAG TPA: tripartite tricarboxylate transporter substrate binding protein [Roseomonas sp.]|jgi:tripartite-type tricarboxylate transporter receptor subunit TctC